VRYAGGSSRDGVGRVGAAESLAVHQGGIRAQTLAHERADAIYGCQSRIVVAIVSIQITIDHGSIVEWARRRRAVPSTYQGKERPWPLKFAFSSTDAALVEIGWGQFFEEFETAGLAFVYRDVGPDGEFDDFHQFVKRAAVPELAISRTVTIPEQAI
jgi:hypothetical protein